MTRTGPTNKIAQGLIGELKKKAIVDKAPLWKRIATDLEKSTRSRRSVNLSRLNRFSKENEMIVVPGKVLGSGEITHKVTIAAYAFSEGAIEKLKKQNCDVLLLPELLKKNPKPTDVRILG